MTGMAQNATDICHPAPVIPLTASEPPAKIVIDLHWPDPWPSGLSGVECYYKAVFHDRIDRVATAQARIL
jgi:hypothetical protein